jgi:hypothetical protein
MPDLLNDLAAPGCSKIGSNWDPLRRTFCRAHRGAAMTTLTLRRIKDDFIVTGPDIEPAKFTNRREAKDWCTAHYPGSPIKEIGADASERRTRAMPRKGPLRRNRLRTSKTKNPAGVL